MPKEPTAEETRVTSAVKNPSMPEQRWQVFVVLVFLVLVGIGGMAVLCFKLLHPAATQLIENR